MKPLLFAALLLIAPALANTAPANTAPADGTALFDWQQHPGASLPLDVPLRTGSGQTEPLSQLFHGVPVILDMGYFNCPSLCGLVRASLFDGLAKSGLRAGRDYTFAALSIDPQEQFADAAAAKARDLTESPNANPAALSYVTATQATIDAVTAAVGFRTRFDPRDKQFMHPTGVVLLTGSGTISSYLLGVGYSAGDLRAGLIRARSGGIARAALPILLLCFHYDETTGRYTLAIMKLLRLMGMLTVMTLVGAIVVLRRHRPDGAG